MSVNEFKYSTPPKDLKDGSIRVDSYVSVLLCFPIFYLTNLLGLTEFIVIIVLSWWFIYFFIIPLFLNKVTVGMLVQHIGIRTIDGNNISANTFLIRQFLLSICLPLLLLHIPIDNFIDNKLKVILIDLSQVN